MPEGAQQDAGKPPVKWLTAAEVNSWLSVVRLMTWLPWSIDQQLRRDSNLGMVEYQVMARLSQSPERTLRMSALADLANASLSRLSHLVKRLEDRGFCAVSLIRPTGARSSSAEPSIIATGATSPKVTTLGGLPPASATACASSRTSAVTS